MQDPLVRLANLAWNANDPHALARFWVEALRWELSGEEDGVVSLRATDGTSFEFDFAPVPERKAGPCRLHVDLTTTSVEDQEQAVARLLELGARHLDVGQGPDARHVVLADPEGNEFCIIEPENQFLADCPRLGSISCDGTQQVGYFWSEALGWPLVWDQDEETAIRDPAGTGPMITWGGPPVAPKVGRNRLHLDVAPLAHIDQRAAVEHLVGLGATEIDIGQGDVSWVVMADPDGNEFCVLSPR